MSKVLHALNRDGERWAMLVFYSFCCIVIVQEVVRRYVLNYSSAWGEEAARFSFIYLGWIGAAYAVRERAHIRFDILLQRLAPRGKAVVFIVAEVATIAFACVAMYWSLHTIATLIRFDGQAPVLRVNKAWFEAAVPIGFALVVFRSLQNMSRDIADLRAGREPFAGKAMFEE
jgi:TRAP-type C4-dicarboxylate transport system permease small subunit